MRFVSAIVLAVLLAGCASSRPATKTPSRLTYSTWDHFTFSVKSNWQIFHYWNATATRRDAETAQRQGGWWGEEVPLGDK